MRTKHNFLPGDRVIWNEGDGKVWRGTIVRLLDGLNVAVQWDASREESIAPAWHRRFRREVTCWATETLTDPEGW